MATTISTVPWLSAGGGAAITTRTPLASLNLLNGSKRPINTKNVAFNGASTRSSGLLHCSFLAPSSSLTSSFSGLSLGLDMASDVGVSAGRCHRLVVRAKKYQLCQTKRNRSKKSLARTHGFRVRMSTTSGRAVLQRRRAKGRKVLCTKTHSSSGKHGSKE